MSRALRCQLHLLFCPVFETEGQCQAGLENVNCKVMMSIYFVPLYQRRLSSFRFLGADALPLQCGVRLYFRSSFRPYLITCACIYDLGFRELISPHSLTDGMYTL